MQDPTTQNSSEFDDILAMLSRPNDEGGSSTVESNIEVRASIARVMTFLTGSADAPRRIVEAKRPAELSTATLVLDPVLRRSCTIAGQRVNIVYIFYRVPGGTRLTATITAQGAHFMRDLAAEKARQETEEDFQSLKEALD